MVSKDNFMYILMYILLYTHTNTHTHTYIKLVKTLIEFLVFFDNLFLHEPTDGETIYIYIYIYIRAVHVNTGKKIFSRI